MIRDGISDGEASTHDAGASHATTGLTADSEVDEPTWSPSRVLEKDDAFHVLQNARRRAVLRYLLARPDRERFRMRTVAEAVAAWEHDTTVQQLDSDERQRVYIALYQSHLPKLDDHDVIEYDQDRGVIEPLPLLEPFDPYLEDGLDAADEEFVAPAAADEDDQSPAESRAVRERLLDVISG